MGMGTGKTLTTLAYAIENDLKRVLVVAPKSVIDTGVWRRDIEKHTEGYTVITLDAKTSAAKIKQVKEARKVALEQPVVVVVNYESAWRPNIADYLINFKFDLVVADEAQNIKAYNSKQSRYMAKLGRAVPYRLALTGTPFHNGLLDIFGIARFIDPAIFGLSWEKFRFRYATWYGFGQYVRGDYINMDEFYAKVDSFSFRVSSTILDLPDSYHVTRYIQMPEQLRKLYTSLSKQFISDYNGDKILADNVLTQLLRLHQLTGGTAVVGESPNQHEQTVSTYKGDALKSLLDEYDLDEPIVIFYKYNADLSIIIKAVNATGRSSYLLNGQYNEWAAWNSPGNVFMPVLLVQYESGSSGIDLTKARYAIFYSIGWSLGDYEQAQARLVRPGQTEKVTFVHLVVENSIDSLQRTALLDKAEPIGNVLANMKNQYK